MQYIVYILFSEKTKKHYIGQTQNLKERIKRHNAGVEKYTARGKPWKLIACTTLPSRSDAMKLERKLKNFKSTARLNQWIEEVAGSEKRTSQANVNEVEF